MEILLILDQMLEGKFKSFKHKHTFIEKTRNWNVRFINKLLMEYLEKLFDKLLLKKTHLKFIAERNNFIENPWKKQ
jgi:hypothetical protein